MLSKKSQQKSLQTRLNKSGKSIRLANNMTKYYHLFTQFSNFVKNHYTNSFIIEYDVTLTTLEAL